ncbi:hypothetical protein CRENBAI_007936 [Crenichthys baileyi]|uniref:Uncharacterized protein n=1 Tax=Crenichthys baileyi TaxID=28760 RepID=A0AAV9S0Y7_9TELE
MDLADEHQASSMDLFTFLSREMEKTLRRSAGLSVPQSAFDGSRLVIPCLRTGPLSRRSPSPPLHTPVKPSSSSRRKKCQRGAPSCVSAGEESPMAAAVRSGAVVSLPADAFQGFSEGLVLVLVPEPCDEGFEDEPPFDPVPERFKDEPPPDPVPEHFEKELVLVLAS